MAETNLPNDANRDDDAQSAPRYTGIATFFRGAHVPEASAWRGVDIGLIGMPYDGGSTNRPGSRHGPRAVREMSTMIAPFNTSLLMNPFETHRIADLGDAWVREPFALEPALKEVHEFYARVHAAGITPISVGGDHSLSLSILRALGAKRPLAMVHFDALCDTGMGYMGSKYHHGAPFARAVEEGLLDPKRTVQIGIRGPMNSNDIWKFSRDSGMRVVSMDECVERGVASVMAEARQIVGDAPCYLSFDIDCIDPAFAPGTGTPVIGGFTTREALQLVRGVEGLDLVGGDLVEVSPPWDVSNLTSLAAANLVFEIICQVSRAMSRRAKR
jgi:guanidinopropionase